MKTLARSFLTVLALLAPNLASAQTDTPEKVPGTVTKVPGTVGELVERIPSLEATQAAAVDESAFYAIGNSVLVRYDKTSGKEIARWEATDDRPLKHLNSGLVHDGKLYCCHSNFPAFPETSSIEIFDPESLQHLGTHSFGIYEGSLTWIDWHDDAWWAVFAHYSKKVNDDPLAKPHTYTSLVKFDSQWRRLEGWVFPENVLQQFAPHSCSGGRWGPDGRLYVTGHDLGELYVLEFPKAGSRLIWQETISVPITGQGIAWDFSGSSATSLKLYGIDRKQRGIVVANVPNAQPTRRAEEKSSVQ